MLKLWTSWAPKEGIVNWSKYFFGSHFLILWFKTVTYCAAKNPATRSGGAEQSQRFPLLSRKFQMDSKKISNEINLLFCVFFFFISELKNKGFHLKNKIWTYMGEQTKYQTSLPNAPLKARRISENMNFLSSLVLEIFECVPYS